jgi:transketolase
MVDTLALERIAEEVRRKIVTMCYHAGGGHIAPSLSCVEILVALYFRILNVNRDNYGDNNRDRFILSKGHACAALYAALSEKGILEKNIWLFSNLIQLNANQNQMFGISFHKLRRSGA